MRLTAREPTQAEIAEAMSNEPLLKVVRVTGKKLKSLWVEGTYKDPQVISVGGKLVQAFAITYIRGKLSSNGKYGIWCCKDMNTARKQAQGNGPHRLCAIFKAYPIGEQIERPGGYGGEGTVLYPAIILGRRVVKLIDNRGY